jgi:hypothetical protein
MVNRHNGLEIDGMNSSARENFPSKWKRVSILAYTVI